MGNVYIRGGGGLGNSKLGQATAEADHVIAGKTFYAGDKELKTGTLPEYEDQNYTITADDLHKETRYTDYIIPSQAYTFGGPTYIRCADSTLADFVNLTPGVLTAGATVLGVPGTAWMPVGVVLAYAVSGGNGAYAYTTYTSLNSVFGTFSGGGSKTVSGSVTVTFTVTKPGYYRVSGASQSGNSGRGVFWGEAPGDSPDNRGSTSTSATYVGEGKKFLSAGNTIKITATATSNGYDYVSGGTTCARTVLISYVGQ